MTDANYGEFRGLFDDLVATFGRRFSSEAERTRCVAQYFDHMRDHAIGDVRRGFDKLRSGEKFPSGPEAWRVAIPKFGLRNLLPMTDAEMRASDDAERQGYEGELCRCAECVAASVTHQPLRYVPIEDTAGELMRRRHPRTGYEKILGEWIHGERLRNWYTARANFFELQAKFKQRVMPKAQVESKDDPTRMVTV